MDSWACWRRASYKHTVFGVLANRARTGKGTACRGTGGSSNHRDSPIKASLGTPLREALAKISPAFLLVLLQSSMVTFYSMFFIAYLGACFISQWRGTTHETLGLCSNFLPGSAWQATHACRFVF